MSSLRGTSNRPPSLARPAMNPSLRSTSMTDQQIYTTLANDFFKDPAVQEYIQTCKSSRQKPGSYARKTYRPSLSGVKECPTLQFVKAYENLREKQSGSRGLHDNLKNIILSFRCSQTPQTEYYTDDQIDNVIDQFMLKMDNIYSACARDDKLHGGKPIEKLEYKKTKKTVYECNGKYYMKAKKANNDFKYKKSAKCVYERNGKHYVRVKNANNKFEYTRAN